MCSHISAFRVQSNLRSEMMNNIVTLPLGFVESFGSGKLRKTVNECSAATETYLAHQLPDKAGAVATPIGLIILLFVFDWKLGILSLVPVALGFAIMTSMMCESDSERAALIGSIQRRLATITIGIGAAALVVLWFSIKMLTRRITQLADGVRTVQRGDYSFRLTLAGDDELTELGRIRFWTSSRIC